jgi:hypothetical protein
MRLRCLVIALTFLAAFGSDSASARTKRDQTQPQEQKAAPDQRGTDQLPFVVQPLPTKKSADVTEREKREADEKANSDWWTWILTVLTVVALFGQLAVFVAQAYFLKGTLKATADAANAAVVAADHIPRVERAYVFMEPIIDVDNHWARVRYSIFNHGKTPAVILGVGVWFEFRAIPPDNSQHFPIKPILDKYVLPASPNDLGATKNKEISPKILRSEPLLIREKRFSGFGEASNMRTFSESGTLLTSDGSMIGLANAGLPMANHPTISAPRRSATPALSQANVEGL